MTYDFEQMLTETRARLDAMRAKPQQGPAPGTGIGRALDGKIEVEMAADGRLSGLALDPSVLRLDERELAREIMSAVNETWAKRQGLDDDAAAIAAMDPAMLQQRLTELQDQGLADHAPVHRGHAGGVGQARCAGAAMSAKASASLGATTTSVR